MKGRMAWPVRRPPAIAKRIIKVFQRTKKDFLDGFSRRELGRWSAIEGGPLESYIEIREQIRMDTETMFGIQVGFPNPSDLQKRARESHSWVFEVVIAKSLLTAEFGNIHMTTLDHYPKGPDLLDGLKHYKNGPASAAACLFSALESAIKIGLERDAMVEMMNAIVVREVMKA